MAKAHSVYCCQNCGYQTPKWLGRCPECQAWESFVEETYAEPSKAAKPERAIAQGAQSEPTPITAIDGRDSPRLVSGIGEFDRVLGGGLVPGTAVLLGGDPGIGKSTLLLQVMARLAGQGLPVLYATGEESTRQVKLRADRLGTLHEGLAVMAETDVGQILTAAQKRAPALLCVDSIQTVYVPELASAPGAIGQVREAAARLLAFAKRSGAVVLLIGHVTKDGQLAGPRALEHLVDVVLSFEGERGYPFRLLRAGKNRFGSTQELGVFEMKHEGLSEVLSPSELFLAERPKGESGSVVTVTAEGTRPLLVELQALVSPATYGTPRRTALGVDSNRVALLAAVLEKKAGLDLVGLDIFVNVAGGVRLNEPGIDLGLACALASSFVEKAVTADTVVFGEVGLAGELRGVGLIEQRLSEAAKLGFKRAVLPRLRADKRLAAPRGLELVECATLAEAIERLF